MEKDKVESRTEYAVWNQKNTPARCCLKSNPCTEHSRPSAPQQGQALAETVESLLATLRCENPVKVPLPNPEGYREKNLLDDCGECRYCKVVAALAASRPQLSAILQLLKNHKFISEEPFNTVKNLCEGCFLLPKEDHDDWDIYIFHIAKLLGASAAGSTERAQVEVIQHETSKGMYFVLMGQPQIIHPDGLLKFFGTHDEAMAVAIELRKALAGTDTDVAKEKL